MLFFSDNFHRYEWLTLSGRVWTHVTASRWPKCCASSRASARDCLRRRAAAAADRRPKPAEEVAPAPADPSNTPIATMRSASLTSTSNVFRRTATRRRPCKSFLLLIIIIIIFLLWSKTHIMYYVLRYIQHDRKRFGHFLAHSKCYY